MPRARTLPTTEKRVIPLWLLQSCRLPFFLYKVTVTAFFRSWEMHCERQQTTNCINELQGCRPHNVEFLPWFHQHQETWSSLMIEQLVQLRKRKFHRGRAELHRGRAEPEVVVRGKARPSWNALVNRSNCSVRPSDQAGETGLESMNLALK